MGLWPLLPFRLIVYRHKAQDRRSCPNEGFHLVKVVRILERRAVQVLH